MYKEEKSTLYQAGMSPKKMTIEKSVWLEEEVI